MSTTSRAVLAVGAAALAVSLAACSSSGDKAAKSGGTSAVTSAAASTSAPGSTAATGNTTDYSALLIDASDIPVPGVVKGTVATPPQGAGASVAFTAAGGRTVGDTVIVLSSAAAAKAAVAGAVSAARQQVTGAEVTDVPIGSGGSAIRGTNAKGAVAAVVFAEGRALVVLEFDSSANDPVPTSVVQQVATAQDSKIKSGLPA